MTDRNSGRRNASAAEPCPICQGDDWCRIFPSGRIDCYRAIKTPYAGLGVLLLDRSQRQYWKFFPDVAASILGLPVVPRKSVPAITPVETLEKAPDDILAEAYGFIFGECSLGLFHTKMMKERGWLEPIIKARQYISVPSYFMRIRLVKALFERFGDMAKRIPGVIKSKDENGNEIWTLVADDRSNAIWIPVRDVKGRILGVKVRYDDAVDKKTPGAKRAKGWRRYVWLSSSKFGGAGPRVLAHTPLWRRNNKAPYTCDVVRVTEGERKADFTTTETGILTISIPGVSSWKSILPVLEELQAKTVKVAFDADFRKNRSVARSLRDLVRALRDKYVVELEVWDNSDERAKGIDDAILIGREIKTVTGEEAFNLVEQYLDLAENAEKATSAQIDQSPLPELPAFVRERLAVAMPVFTKAWIDNLEVCENLAQSIASILGQAGIDGGLVGSIVSEVASAASERNPQYFGYGARNCAKINLQTPIRGVWSTATRLGIKEALNTLKNELVAELKPDPFNIKGLKDYLDQVEPLPTPPKPEAPLPPRKPFEARTNKPWVTLNDENISRTLRRRFTGLEVASFSEEDIKIKTLVGFFECNTVSRWWNHDSCERSEFAGIKRCQCVACFGCRQQIAFLAREYVKSRAYGNWPERVVVFETLLSMEPTEYFPSRNNVNVNLVIRNGALKNQDFLDDAPRTVVEMDRLRSFMAVDPIKGEAAHIADLQRIAQVNVRILNRDAAIEEYYKSLLVIPQAIDRLFENEDLNGYFSVDPEERQIAADAMRSIIAIINQSLGRRFVLGGRGNLTLPSGLGNEQQKTARRTYNFEEEQLDPNILNPKKVVNEIVFDDGCKCGSTSYTDVHFATEHLNIPGLQEDDESFAKAARYAWDSGEAQTSLREYCTPENLALDDKGHLERLPKTQRVWAPPEAELASV